VELPAYTGKTLASNKQIKLDDSTGKEDGSTSGVVGRHNDFVRDTVNERMQGSRTGGRFCSPCL